MLMLAMGFLVFKPNLKLAVIFVVVTDVAIHAGAGAYAARVTIAPQTVVALVDASASAQFTCEVRDAVGLDWFLDGTHDSSVAGAVSKTDFSVSGGAAVFSSSLSISTTEEFDNLQVVCRARGSTESESSDSDVAWLYLEAPLVTPHSIRVQHEIDSISLTWTCGVAEHVELYYNVTISRDTDKDTVVMETNKTLISFGLDYPFAELCTNYTFSVVAWSELDTSNSSEPVTAGFHCPLPSIPSVSVTPSNLQSKSTYYEFVTTVSGTSDVSATPAIPVPSDTKRDSIIGVSVCLGVAAFGVMMVIIIIIIICFTYQEWKKRERHYNNKISEHHSINKEKYTVGKTLELQLSVESSASNDSNSPLCPTPPLSTKELYRDTRMQMTGQ